MTTDDGAAARLTALLGEARSRARASGRRVLVSVAERVPDTDPLEVLEAAARASAADAAVAGLAHPGMFWTRPVDGFALAGLGAVVTLERAGADRFAAIGREWDELSADALVNDPSGCAPGVGPTLLGGFAFEPEGPLGPGWLGFPGALLAVPRLLLARVGEECWLTSTLLVGADGAPDVPPATLLPLRRRLLATRRRDSAASPASPRAGTLALADVVSAERWQGLVAAAVDAIRAGAMEKVVLAREVRATAHRTIDVTAALRQLRAAHPESFVFACWRGDAAFVGASPERLVKLDGREVCASSLAGSAPRGATRDEDAAHAARLLASAKDRAEHEVVRRALCAGLAALCDDVCAPAEPSLLSLPNVHHLHTAVRARLREGHGMLDLLERLHPTPAVGGTPREAALRFIREHEGLDRGWYAAPVGWLQRDRGEMAVALRSALVRGAEASLFAGCGVMADSDPEREHAETLLKLAPMREALEAALAGRGAGRPLAAAAGEGAR